jgi:hypothetical protein
MRIRTFILERPKHVTRRILIATANLEAARRVSRVTTANALLVATMKTRFARSVRFVKSRIRANYAYRRVARLDVRRAVHVSMAFAFLHATQSRVPEALCAFRALALMRARTFNVRWDKPVRRASASHRARVLQAILDAVPFPARFVI